VLERYEDERTMRIAHHREKCLKPIEIDWRQQKVTPRLQNVIILLDAFDFTPEGNLSENVHKPGERKRKIGQKNMIQG
jgi:hypothetical protein